jgi:hypothetical protein
MAAKVDIKDLVKGDYTVEQLEEQKALRSGHDNQGRSVLLFHINMTEIQSIDALIELLKQ